MVLKNFKMVGRVKIILMTALMVENRKYVFLTKYVTNI